MHTKQHSEQLKPQNSPFSACYRVFHSQSAFGIKLTLLGVNMYCHSSLYSFFQTRQIPYDAHQVLKKYNFKNDLGWIYTAGPNGK